MSSSPIYMLDSITHFTLCKSLMLSLIITWSSLMAFSNRFIAFIVM